MVPSPLLMQRCPGGFGCPVAAPYSQRRDPRGSERAARRLRLIKHARYYWLPLAEDHLTRRLK